MQYKIIGLVFFAAGFTFLSQGIGLNSLAAIVPQSFGPAIQLFTALAIVSGLGFLIAGGLFFFEHGYVVGEQPQRPVQTAAKITEQPRPTIIEPTMGNMAAPQNLEEKREKGWESPSSTGWS
ncbi:MAG: hypothetical protein V1731_02640 [Candidatus Aenigmatarchaeota archaeon]